MGKKFFISMKNLKKNFIEKMNSCTKTTLQLPWGNYKIPLQQEAYFLEKTLKVVIEMIYP